MDVDRERLEVDQGCTNLKLDMDSPSTAAIPRKEVASATERFLVFPPFGVIAKFLLTFRCRALGFDNRVARLNSKIGWERANREWPEPYLLSKLIRCFVYVIKKCWLGTKKALSILRRFAKGHICTSFHIGHVDGDVESLEMDGEEQAKAPGRTAAESLVGEAKSDFCKSLHKTFSDADRVDEMMREIEFWEVGK